MTRGSIREYAEAIRARYLQGSKEEKSKILDEFTKVTGCHRSDAESALRTRQPSASSVMETRQRRVKGVGVPDDMVLL